jgi:hypothetical protein
MTVGNGLCSKTTPGRPRRVAAGEGTPGVASGVATLESRLSAFEKRVGTGSRLAARADRLLSPAFLVVRDNRKDADVFAGNRHDDSLPS